MLNIAKFAEIKEEVFEGVLWYVARDIRTWERVSGWYHFKDFAVDEAHLNGYVVPGSEWYNI